MESISDYYSVVLCRPEGPLNIGSVCRAMQTSGLDKLVIVNPLIDINSRDVNEQIKQMAVHAYSVFESAEIYSDLKEYALKCTFCAGITRRKGSKRKFFSILPEELAQMTNKAGKGLTALVFGNEQSGLNDKELSCCDCAVQIPSSPDFPSLNLSHAVQIICYSVFRGHNPISAGYTPVSRDVYENLKNEFMLILKEAGFFEKPDRFRTEQLVQDILARSAMSRREAGHIERIFKKLRYLILNMNDSRSS